MEIHSFSRTVANSIDEYGSKAFAYSKIAQLDGRYRIGCAWVEPRGVIGEHPAGVEQLFLVVAGSATVSGRGASPLEVSQGSAVLWKAGELHETTAGQAGLVAIIIQGEDLRSALEMPPTAGAP